MDDQAGFDTRETDARLMIACSSDALGREQAEECVMDRLSRREFVNVEDLERIAGAKGVDAFLAALDELLGPGAAVPARFRRILAHLNDPVVTP